MPITKETIQDHLKKAYLFKGFSNEEISKIVLFCKQEALDSGDQLFERGTRNEALYIIHYGSVRLHGVGPEGEHESSLMVGAGGLIGEAAIVSKHPRIMSADVLEHTDLIKIFFNDLQTFFDSNSAAALKFYRSLSEHLANSLHSMILEVIRVREAHHIEKHGLRTM